MYFKSIYQYLLQCFLIMIFSLCIIVNHAFALEAMSNDEMSEVHAQSLLFTDYQAPNTASAAQNYGFYTVGLNASVSMNANIKDLKLGCSVYAGASGCDLDLENVSYGCVTDTSGSCITIGENKTAVGMKDFVQTNPFIQFAVKNPKSASTRSVVGVRLGAQHVNGPMSIGNINTLSGYVSGRQNFSMLGQGVFDGSLPATGNNIDLATAVATTCGTSVPVPGGCPGNNAQSFLNPFGNNGVNPYGANTVMTTTGLNNDCLLRIIVCVAQVSDNKVAFQDITVSNRRTIMSGKRQTQSFVYDLNFSTGQNLVNGVMEDGIVKRFVAAQTIVDTKSVAGVGLSNLLSGALNGAIGSSIQRSLAQGFNTDVASLENNTFLLPYNVKNNHQLDIDTNGYGLSLQKEAVQYPGYVAAVPMGFAMYLGDAYSISLAAPTSILMNQIMDGTASAGNHGASYLKASYKNCFGSRGFC